MHLSVSLFYFYVFPLLRVFLGDFAYKQNKDLSAEEQMITAHPEVRQILLTDADEFIVLACDGIWECLGDQKVVDFVRDRLIGKVPCKSQDGSGNCDSNGVVLSNIIADLFDSIISEGTDGDCLGCDNMTCLLVVFKSWSERENISIAGSGTRKIVSKKRKKEKTDRSQKSQSESTSDSLTGTESRRKKRLKKQNLDA